MGDDLRNDRVSNACRSGTKTAFSRGDINGNRCVFGSEPWPENERKKIQMASIDVQITHSFIFDLTRTMKSIYQIKNE